MSKIICVTNRRLCREDFLERIRKVAEACPAGILLREKDLSEREYETLARPVLELCRAHQIPCILHSFAEVALELGAEAFHAPLPVLREMTPKQREAFSLLGTSCHSVEEAQEGERLGCTYLIAGHVFETDCKQGLPGRGLEFLQAVCEAVSIPVYGIGGIRPETLGLVCGTGAKGACVMSGLMQCEDAGVYLKHFERAGERNEIS